MKLFVLAFAQCLRRLCLVTPLGIAASAVGVRLGGPTTTAMAGGDANALSLWLHLPLFATALTAVATAVESWPLFARARPGAGWIERLRPGPWRGCGAAILGALAASALGCIGIGALAPWLIPGTPTPRAQVTLRGASELPVLGGDFDRQLFAVPGGRRYDELQLRARAFVPRSELVPTTLQVLGDGEPLTTASVAVLSTDKLVQLRFSPRPLRQVELRRTGGSVPLAFPPGSVVAIDAVPHSRVINAVLAALGYLLPTFVALAAAALGARALALPFGLTLVMVAMLLATLGGLSPTGELVAAMLRGRWLIDAVVFRSCLPSLGAGALAMILAMAMHWRARR